MTDLEITRKCAEKMGLTVYGAAKQGVWGRWPPGEEMTEEDYRQRYPVIDYDPLHDDAQAMALIRKYASEIRRDENGDWNVKINRTRSAPGACAYRQPDLNRAICECVANFKGV